ncbi:hypothetical protein TRVL_07241 [Trypanosoma vivax]|nr:hypothetical protein TRVL_07241 [Trypanosoma vivax]
MHLDKRNLTLRYSELWYVGHTLDQKLGSKTQKVTTHLRAFLDLIQPAPLSQNSPPPRRQLLSHSLSLVIKHFASAYRIIYRGQIQKVSRFADHKAHGIYVKSIRSLLQESFMHTS